MLCELAGPRGWHDTRESWLARGARRAGITLRRAKALFYAERLSLSANEYLGILDAYETASSALQEAEDMDRAARAIAASADAMGKRCELVRDAEAQIARTKALAGECGAAAAGPAVRSVEEC